jgi:predicted enzyme related to lactoylglutathione lyase
VPARTGKTDVVRAYGHFAWYELMTTDIEAAKAFYTKVMGWGAQDASGPGRPYVLFTAGRAVIGGLMGLPDSAWATGGKPYWMGYVGVEDVDAAVARIEQLGGAVHVPPTDIPNISRFAVFADPQTATLALLTSHGPDHAQAGDVSAPGRVGWHELFAADRDKALVFYGALFGWQKADADIGELGYQLFSAGAQTIGGMLTKPPIMPAPFWLYYFNIDNIEAAAKRVEAGGGKILEGPSEGPAGSWTVQCTDPQGALFALEAQHGRRPIGYFERAGSRDRPDAPRRRWSW